MQFYLRYILFVHAEILCLLNLVPFNVTVLFITVQWKWEAAAALPFSFSYSFWNRGLLLKERICSLRK